jgi:hypothetical protein
VKNFYLAGVRLAQPDDSAIWQIKTGRSKISLAFSSDFVAAEEAPLTGTK